MISVLKLLRELLPPGTPRTPSIRDRIKEVSVSLEHGQYEKAILLSRAILEEYPEDIDAKQMLGLAAMGAGKTEIAYECLTDAVALRPWEAAYHNNLGSLFNLLGRPVDARVCFRKALEINPQMPSARSNLIYTVIMLADERPESIYREHVEWAAIHAEPLRDAILPHLNTRSPDRKLKIGYISADFRLHALTIFMDPIFRYYDRERFSVHCYYSSRVVDSMTEMIRNLVDGFHDIADADDVAAAEMVRRDEIDILVDLSGHLRGNRLLVFARKPAPVQITYLAYPGTTGMSAMDFRITDDCCDPPGAHDHHYRETLVRLPGCMWCFSPPEGMPEVSESPALKGGYVTFASTNAIVKVTEEMLDVWAAILNALPESRMVFATVPEHGRQRVLATLARLGIDPERVTFHERMSRERFWAMYSQIDILLDTYPCNGGTTTCEALWLGVPAVTLRGDFFQSRAGYSILNSIGLEELVADSKEEYRDKALELATDRDKLAEMRRKLRDRMRASPLLDAKGFTRNVESLYREIWRDCCSRS